MIRSLFVICLIVLGLPDRGFVQVQVEGRVTDQATHQPLAGATILETGTRHAAITDELGYFSLVVPDSADSIRVSYVGYESRHIAVPDGSAFLNIKLAPGDQSIPQVVIRGNARLPDEMLFHHTRLSARALNQEGSSSNTSVYNKLTRMPGVSVESQDISGLSEKSVRVRGVKSYFTGMTVEGIPNYGIMPIGPRDYLYDMENIGSVSLYKGAIPADVFSATGNKGGVIRLDFKRPGKDAGVTLRQSVGSDVFARSLVRFDVGKLPSGTAVFGSYSFTRANKWKGSGDVGPRHNITLGVTQDLGERFTAEVFALYNHLRRHDFRELTYDQARNISTFHDLHFLQEPGITARDQAYYFDNNRGTFINTALYGNLQYRPGRQFSLSLKPYYLREDADLWHKQVTGPPSAPNYMLFNRQRDDQKTGFTAKAMARTGKMRLSAGYWFEQNSLAARVHVYRLVTDAERQDMGVNPLTDMVSPGFIHNPYLKIAGRSGKWSWHAGLKYFYYTGADEKYYSQLEGNRTPLPFMDVEDVDYSAWLPTLGTGWLVSDHLQFSLSYGRNYMRPYMYGPTRSLYLRQSEKFLEQDIQFQDILEKWKMETSDQLSLRVAWQKKRLNLEVTPFAALHHDVLTPVLDPQVGIEYPQNVGEVKSYGVEMQGHYETPWNMLAWFNLTWMDMGYDEDLRIQQSGQTQSLNIKGNQTPSVPRISAYAGLRYQYRQWMLSGRIRHVGTRYGDATNQEKIPAHSLFHLKGRYSLDVSWARELSLGIEVRNLLDVHYVGRIVAMDYEGSGSTVYYAGMPRSLSLNLYAKF
mgnify:CR=1 FL=1